MDILYKSVTTAPAVVVLLELDKLEFAKGLKNILQILLRNTKMDVAHVKTVERNRVGVVSSGLRGAHLAVFLSLGKLDDDRNT